MALVLASCLGAGVAYQQWTNPAAVRQQVVEMLQRQFPGATITLDGARLRLLGGVVLSELRLLRHIQDGEGAEANDVIHIPQATVYHDKERLLRGEFAVRRIEMLRPRIRIVRGRDGQWNVEGLTGKAEAAGPMPVIVVKQGTVVVEDNYLGPANWELHDVNLTLLNDNATNLTFTGGGHSPALGHTEVRGTWNRTSNALALSLRTTELSINKDLVQYISTLWPDDRLKGLTLKGKAEINADLIYDPQAVVSLKPEVLCQVRQVALEHPKLPVPLHNLSATLRCDGSKVVLERLKAAAGPGKVECHGWADLKDLENSFAGELNAYHLPVTKDLVNRLPGLLPRLQVMPRLYELFKPLGRVNFQCLAEKKQGAWLRCYCTLDPDNVDVCFEKFPYPLERVSGFVDYDYLQRISNFQVVGYSGAEPISVKGSWKGSLTDADASIEIKGNNLPLDEKLLKALKPSLREQAKDFHPSGKGDFQGLIRLNPGNPEYLGTYHIHFVDCNLKWKEFPFPLEHVTGDLIVYPNNCYEFKNFHGTHHGGEVFVEGRKTPIGDALSGGKLSVNIVGRNICLDADLRAALKDYARLNQTWDAFKPAGRLNFQTKVEQLPNQPKDMDVSVEVAGCAIEPSFFPYPLHDVTGQFRYHKDKVVFANFTARHEASQLSIGHGTIDLPPAGGFYAEIDDLRANPIVADEAFLQALPQGLLATARAINLKDQTLALQTKLVVSKGPEPLKPPEVFWDAQVWVRDAILKAGVPLDHVTGTLHCRGLHNGKQLAGMTGNLYLNEAIIFKQPVQAARGHFVVHENAPDAMWFSLRAPIFGGDVSGQGRLDFRPSQRVDYEVDLTASQIRLEDFGQYNMGPQHQLAGIAAARLHLQGHSDDPNGLEGNGSIDIPYTPMTRLLNLPFLLDLLKFLGLRWPDRTAFEEAHAAFAIHGSRVAVNKLELLGNAVSLYGKGEVNLDGSDLLLDMYTGWGRAEQVLPPAVRYIPSAISKQLLRVEVRGKLSGNENDLQFHKRPVPGLVEPLLDMKNRVMGKGTDPRR